MFSRKNIELSAISKHLDDNDDDNDDNKKIFFFFSKIVCIVVLHVTTKFEFILSNIERCTVTNTCYHHQQVQNMSFKKIFFLVSNELYSCITRYYKV